MGGVQGSGLVGSRRWLLERLRSGWGGMGRGTVACLGLGRDSNSDSSAAPSPSDFSYVRPALHTPYSHMVTLFALGGAAHEYEVKEQRWGKPSSGWLLQRQVLPGVQR